MPELSRSTEDYLKAIYALGRHGDPVQTSALADELHVAAPSVSGMLKRMAEAGLLRHAPYRGVQLTDSGSRSALRIIRRHRILETYLTTRLGFDWGGVHSEAERLEHAASDELIDRMAESLGNPRFDPHGAPIPTADGLVEEPELLPLTDVAVGDTGEFRMVSDKDPERLRFLTEQGFGVGTRFTVLAVQPFNGPVTVRRLEAGAEPQVIGHELARALRCLVAESVGA